MELREFAERVLFSTSLEEKLRAPEGITDEQPGSALATPSGPGPKDARVLEISPGASGPGR